MWEDVHDDHSEMGHSAKLATNRLSTIFFQASWNLEKIIFSWGGYIDQFYGFWRKLLDFPIVTNFAVSHFRVVFQ